MCSLFHYGLRATHAETTVNFYTRVLGMVVDQTRPKIGIAFEGGGALALAQIGVLQWLEEHKIPVDYIAGASMGGLVFSDGTTFMGLGVPDRDAAPGLAALRHPPAEVGAVVAAHWAELTDPATPADRFAALVNVPIAPAPPLEERPTCAT